MSYGRQYRGIKIKVLNSPIYPRITDINEQPKKMLNLLRYNKNEIVDYEKVREKYLFHDGEQEEIDEQYMQDLFDDVRLLMLNDIEIHISAKDDSILIILVEYGPLVYNKNKALEFKSILNMYEDLQNYEINLTSDGRIAFITGDEQAIKVDHENIMSIFSEVLDYRLNDSGLISNDEMGGLIAKYDDQQFHAGREDIILLAPDDQVMNYLRSFVNQSRIPYKRMIIVGGERPDGFTEFQISNSGYDLVEMIDNTNRDQWIPVMRLIEKIYNLNNFSTYFQELWMLFKESVTEEQKDLIDFQFLINRINDSEVNMIASLEDYKKQIIQIGFSLFDNRIMKKGGKTLPNRLWLPISNNKETVVVLSYLLSYNLELDKGYELMVINDTKLSRYINQEGIYDQLKLIGSTCRIFVSDQPELWNNKIRMFIKPNPNNLYHLSRIDRDVSVLSGNHLLLSNGDLISGIHYSHEYFNWDVEEHQQISQYLEIKVTDKTGEIEAIEETEDTAESETETEPIESHTEINDSLFEEFYEIMGVKDYVYRAYQNMPSYDHKLRLDLIEQMSRSFDLLLTIRYTIGGQINFSQLDAEQQGVVEELFDNGLINRVVVSGDDKVLELLPRGNKFIDKSVDALVHIEKSKIYLDNMSIIREHAESMGPPTYLRTLIAFAQLISAYYYKNQNKLNNILAAINHTWDDSILDNPDNFNKLFFARYYSRMQEIYEEAGIIEEEMKVDLSRIPTLTDEVVDIIEDPLETMEVVTVKKVKKSSPYVPKETKQVKAEDTDWIQKYDTPVADGVSKSENVKTDKIPSFKVGSYVILGAENEVSMDILELDIDNLKINTRSRNLLKEHGISTIKQLKDFDRPFVSIDGIGEKLNETLSQLRKQLRKMTDPHEILKHLSDEGKKEFVLTGGSIEDMDHSYLRRISEEDKSELNDLISGKETPLELVEAVSKWILEKLSRNPGDKLEEMLNDLGLLQERSNPLLLIEGNLVKLGFPYVYKKQDEFEDSIEYSKIIAELRDYIGEQVQNLVFPVQTIQSAGSLMDKIDKLELNADERTSFSTARSAYQSNDYKSAFTLHYNTFEGYLRRVCEQFDIMPESDGDDCYMADLTRQLNRKMKLELPVKPFEGELRMIRNAITHGNAIDERRIGSGLYELVKYIIPSIEKITALVKEK